MKIDTQVFCSSRCHNYNDLKIVWKFHEIIFIKNKKMNNYISKKIVIELFCTQIHNNILSETQYSILYNLT